MTATSSSNPVLYLPDGIAFDAGPDRFSVSPVKVPPTKWIALVPDGPEPVVDPSAPLSRILSTMQEPHDGTVELFGRHVYRLDYGTRQRLRARIGFVHGYGGLLSNRSIEENISLPVSVHGHLKVDEEADLVNATVRTFGLEKVAGLRPHEVDGGTRWHVCLARSLVLRPEWLVMEGIGTWEMDRGRSTAWKALMERRNTSAMAAVICLPRQNPGFETWFEKSGGSVIRYERIHKPSDRRY